MRHRPTIESCARLLLARFRRLALARPDILSRPSWYLREAERIRGIARTAGVDESLAIDAAAVLSPAVRWEDLVRRLPAFLAAVAAGAPPELLRFPGYWSNIRKAAAVLRGERRPTGPKVSRFARNLRGEPSAVTVDRWAARAAGLPESGGAGWYQLLEDAYRVAAGRVRLSPARFQAILWEGVREGAVRFDSIGPQTSQDAPGSTIGSPLDQGHLDSKPVSERILERSWGMPKRQMQAGKK